MNTSVANTSKTLPPEFVGVIVSSTTVGAGKQNPQAHGSVPESVMHMAATEGGVDHKTVSKGCHAMGQAMHRHHTLHEHIAGAAQGLKGCTAQDHHADSGRASHVPGAGKSDVHER